MSDRQHLAATIRPGTAAESAAVAALVTAQGLPTQGLDAAWLTLVAERAGRLVGVAALEMHGDREAPAFLLRSVAVHAGSRDAGVGAALVGAALAAADARSDAPATVGLLTETADGWFGRFGFRAVDRAQLPAALAASAELTGACPASARAFLRPGGPAR